MVAPNGTPETIVSKISTPFKQSRQRLDFKQRSGKIGSTIPRAMMPNKRSAFVHQEQKRGARCCKRPQSSENDFFRKLSA